MRVFVLNSARKYIGEAAHCVDLVRELAKRGHDALLIVRAGYEVEQRARAAGVPTVAMNFSSQFAPRQDVDDLRALLRLVKLHHPDIVHCHRGKDHWLAATARLMRASTFPPIVRTRHVVVPVAQHWANRMLFERLTAQTIGVSRAAAQSLGAIGIALGERLRVIYSAVDLETFSPSKRSQGTRERLGVGDSQQLVGLIARIQNVKGQRIFLRAARLAARLLPECRFLIAGRGSEIKFEALAQQAHELGIEQQVIFRQWLDDLPNVLASLDVSVIASLGSEGSSRIAYESMASGVPLVATRVGCLPEIIEDRRTGLLVPPGNAEALARAIVELLNNRRLAMEIAQSALERARTFHNYDRWIAEILDVYEAARSGAHASVKGA